MANLGICFEKGFGRAFGKLAWFATAYDVCIHPNFPITGTQAVGVIGDPIAHSLSPRLHEAAFKALGLTWHSHAYLVRSGEVQSALEEMKKTSMRGVSVTMPHKDAVFELVDDRSDVAKKLGAVNCVVNNGGHLIGHNTDGQGFIESLERGATFDPAGKRCVVIGAGGAARAVILALGEAGAKDVVVVNRTPAKAEAAASLVPGCGRVGQSDDARGAELIVDATPASLGGLDHVVSPGPGQVAVDLVYVPTLTPWLEQAGANGARVVSGLGMLVHQAGVQITLWTGEKAPLEAMWACLEDLAK